ncbi:MAG: ABC transporter ATP-binding protein [Alphaproteobacteria bacterium]|nr:ABC transporter ATP-binding protein [Alphaproteobacteria bacterium]
MTPALAFEGVSAGYSDEAIVRDLSCTIEDRSVTCLIGANGAGKSTLLKSAFGLVRHLGGRLIYRGEAIHELLPEARLQRGIALVPQGRCNFQDMTVRENLWLGAYTLARPAAEAAIGRRVAQFPMLGRKWNQLAGNLSGGEQQILEMSMALLVDPTLLLLDEPSLGLSPKTMNEVFAVIRALAASGVTVVMVEQNVHGALAISDRVIVLDLGQKIFEGPPTAVMADAHIRTAFLGAAP